MESTIIITLLIIILIRDYLFPKRNKSRNQKRQESSKKDLLRKIMPGLNQLSELERDGDIHPEHRFIAKHGWDVLATIIYRNSGELRQILKQDNDIKRRTRIYNRWNNDGNQHPEPNEDTLDSLRDEDGKTYSWTNHMQYGVASQPQNGFNDATTYGSCAEPGCDAALPVWRACIPCMQSYITQRGINIFQICMSCIEQEHVEALQDFNQKCPSHGGPREPQIAAKCMDPWDAAPFPPQQQ